MFYEDNEVVSNKIFSWDWCCGWDVLLCNWLKDLLELELILVRNNCVHGCCTDDVFGRMVFFWFI